MAGFAEEKALRIDDDALGRARELFVAHRVDEEETLAVMADIFEKTGEMIDPHTAVGIAAAKALSAEAETPVITLATAHPAKFPEAFERATGQPPPMPPELEALMTKPERLTVLPNDLGAVQAHIDQLPMAN